MNNWYYFLLARCSWGTLFGYPGFIGRCLCVKEKKMCVGLGSPLPLSWPPASAGGVVLARSAVLGAVLLAFLPRRRLGFAMSLASFVSSLPVLGAVSSVSRPVSALASVPRARWSAAVGVVAVVRSGEDSVSVVCSDGRTRVCRPSYASRALGRPVSPDAVFSRLSARVGSSVRFCAAFGYSPDQWFVGVEGV